MKQESYKGVVHWPSNVQILICQCSSISYSVNMFFQGFSCDILSTFANMLNIINVLKIKQTDTSGFLLSVRMCVGHL
jgi:hypothetical protein